MRLDLLRSRVLVEQAADDGHAAVGRRAGEHVRQDGDHIRSRARGPGQVAETTWGGATRNSSAPVF